MNNLLDPKTIAKHWCIYWDKNTPKKIKEMNVWVDDAIRYAILNDPDYAFAIIEAIHELDEDQIYDEIFSAGPIEDLLSHHGDYIISKFENKAKVDRKFAHVLGGVWQSSMTNEIWTKIKNCRKTDGWASVKN